MLCIMIFVLQETRFKETGVITPNEFVNAGDHLVHTCPTWEWACGDDCKIKSYLPKNKQYLITRNVPCLRRYKQVMSLKQFVLILLVQIIYYSLSSFYALYVCIYFFVG